MMIDCSALCKWELHTSLPPRRRSLHQVPLKQSLPQFPSGCSGILITTLIYDLPTPQIITRSMPLARSELVVGLWVGRREIVARQLGWSRSLGAGELVMTLLVHAISKYAQFNASLFPAPCALFLLSCASMLVNLSQNCRVSSTAELHCQPQYSL